jgi:hypothetical protein
MEFDFSVPEYDLPSLPKSVRKLLWKGFAIGTGIAIIGGYVISLTETDHCSNIPGVQSQEYVAKYEYVILDDGCHLIAQTDDIQPRPVRSPS